MNEASSPGSPVVSALPYEGGREASLMMRDSAAMGLHDSRTRDYFLVSNCFILGMISPGCLCCAYFHAPSLEALTNHLAVSGERRRTFIPPSVSLFKN